jgi:hypothetical protein
MSSCTKSGSNLRIFTTVEEGYSADRHGPRKKEEEGGQCNLGRDERANILEYVVTIRRNNVLYGITVNNQQKVNG